MSLLSKLLGKVYSRVFGRNGSLTLVVKGQELRFGSLAEFGYACAGRTSLPPERLARIHSMSLDQLRDEHQDISLLLAKLAEIVADSARDPALLQGRLRDVPINSISSDNDWRAIFSALREQQAGPEYIQVALGHYLQYLANRQQVFRLEAQQGGGSSAAAINRLSLRLGDSSTRKDYQRLPKGRAVVLGLTPGEPVELILSRHKCRMSVDDHVMFTHFNDQQEECENKRIAIGREKINDIIIDPSWRDVSRLHLVVENLGNGNIKMTDLSSHGTFLPVEFMGKIKYSGESKLAMDPGLGHEEDPDEEAGPGNYTRPRQPH